MGNRIFFFGNNTKNTKFYENPVLCPSSMTRIQAKTRVRIDIPKLTRMRIIRNLQ